MPSLPLLQIQELQNFFVYLSTSLSIEMIIKIVISCLLIIWFAVAVWVIKDITTRSTSIIVQTFSLLLIIFFTPIFWLPLYLLIRPRSTLFEQHYEENWLENFEGQSEMELIPCNDCWEKIGCDAKFCPYCGSKQFDTCKECSAKMLINWKYCTSCGTPRDAQKKEISREKSLHSKSKDKKSKRWTSEETEEWAKESE